MFIITGIATFFIGWLQHYFIRKHAQSAPFATVYKVCMGILFLIGIGAVATMWTNPFAYLALLVAIYQLIGFSKYKNQQTNYSYHNTNI